MSFWGSGDKAIEGAGVLIDLFITQTLVAP